MYIHAAIEFSDSVKKFKLLELNISRKLACFPGEILALFTFNQLIYFTVFKTSHKFPKEGDVFL